MTKKIVKRTDANNETLYFYTHSDAVDVGEGSSMKSLTEVIDDTLHKSPQTLTNAEKTQVHANLGTESFVGDRAVRYDEAQVLGSSEKTQALVNLGLNGVDDVPTENSNNVVRSGGVKEAIDDFTNRGFIYKGIAPASAPLGEDKTFYIAKSGDYTAYTGIGDGSFTLNGIAVLTYAVGTTSGAWTKNDIVLFDDEPTAGSDNLVKSGGVAEKFVVLVKEDLDDPVNGYFDDEGNRVASSSYRYWTINIKPEYKSVSVRVVSLHYAIAFFGSNGFISGVYPSPADAYVHWVHATIPTNATSIKVVCTNTYSDNADIRVLSDLGSVDAALQQAIDKLDNVDLSLSDEIDRAMSKDSSLEENEFDSLFDMCYNDSIQKTSIDTSYAWSALGRISVQNEKLAICIESSEDISRLFLIISNYQSPSSDGAKLIFDSDVEGNKKYYFTLTNTSTQVRYLGIKANSAIDSLTLSTRIVYLNTVKNLVNDTNVILEESIIQNAISKYTLSKVVNTSSSVTDATIPVSLKKAGQHLLFKITTDVDTEFILSTSSGASSSSIIETIGVLLLKADKPYYVNFTPTADWNRLFFGTARVQATVTITIVDSLFAVSIFNLLGYPDSWDSSWWNSGGYIANGTVKVSSGYSYTSPIYVNVGDVIVGHTSRYGLNDDRNSVFSTDSAGTYYNVKCRLYLKNGNNDTGFVFVSDKDEYIAFNRRDSTSYQIHLYRRTSLLNELIKSTEMQFRRYPMPECIGILKNMSANIHHGSGTLEKPVTLLHISDIHQSRNNLYSIREFADTYGEYLSDVICTGDMSPSKLWDFNPDIWQESRIRRFLLTVGNHDVYDADNQGSSGGTGYDDLSKRATRQEVYNKIFAPVIDDWNVTQPTDAEANGYCYYYKDYNTTIGASSYIVSAVRLIVIDAMDGGYKDEAGSSEAASEVQRTWLTNVLEDARQQGYPVVIAEHFPPIGSGSQATIAFDTPFHSYENGMDYSYLTHNIGWAADAVDTFINNGGEFVCWLCGHLHYDHVGVSAAHPNQIYIAIASASTGIVWQDSVRDARYDTKDLFNVISIDPHYKRISVYRFGAKWDKWMRHREAMCIDYANKKLLSTY